MERLNSNISGTRVNTSNAQLLVSSGIPSLDQILGGGLPVGTIAILEEDINGAYSKTVCKYFVAEGVVSKHSIFLASQDVSPYKMIKELPAVIESDSEAAPLCTRNVDTDDMKIAFRYQNLPTSEVETSNFGHYFDLTKTMPPDDIDEADISCWDGNKLEIVKSSYTNPAYNALLKSIKDMIKEGKFFLKDNQDKKKILRIGIHSLGSPMWIPNKNDYFLQNTPQNRDLDQFIFCLRALVRSAYAVAFITIPSHLYKEDSLLRCIHSSDIAMKLQSFSGTELESNRSLSDYQGFFQLRKLAAINSMVSKHPGLVDFAFKLRRKKFTIEKLHLPPDLSDVSESKKTRKEKENIPSLGCGSTGKHLLEF